MHPPRNGSVHVHFLVPDDGKAIETRARLVLDEAESRREAAYTKLADRKLFLAGRLLLRQILGAYLSRSAEKLRFNFSSFGKPGLELPHETSDLQFNLSHTQDLICLAVMRSNMVGVDVEMRRALRERKRFITRWLDTSANDRISELCIEDQDNAALIEWTRLEASLKLSGEGVAALGRGGCLDRSKIYLSGLDCGKDHVGTVATYIKPTRVIPMWWQVGKGPVDSDSGLFLTQ